MTASATRLDPGIPVRVARTGDPFDGRSGVVVQWEEAIGPDRVAVEFDWSTAKDVLGLQGCQAPDFPFVRFYQLATVTPLAPVYRRPTTREEAIAALGNGALEIATEDLFEEYLGQVPSGQLLVYAIEHGTPEAIAEAVRNVWVASHTNRAPGGEWFNNSTHGQQITDALLVLADPPVRSRHDLYKTLPS